MSERNPAARGRTAAVERFIGTVKRGLKEEPLTSDKDFEAKLTSIRLWYNHDRPHDHLQGRTPAEVWAGIDVLKARSS
ncbi:integrase core domain-containing protein [Nitrospira sp. ND1]|uniref:integrase core domain-containing protein n=1 Tax=Nitrospira sp. ND1 TaxID=1658518 RepID=UPI0035133F24